MTRRNNPSLSSLMPIIILGGAALFMLSKGIGTQTPTKEQKAAITKLQIALNNLLHFVDVTDWNASSKTFGVPTPYSGVFDPATADAYNVAANIVGLAQQKAGVELDNRGIYQVIPTIGMKVFENDVVLPIVGADKQGATTMPVSSKFADWLVKLWYSDLGETAPGIAVTYMTEWARRNSTPTEQKNSPDRNALYSAGHEMYPQIF